MSTLSALRAHRGSLAGTAVVLAVAGALLSTTGVLMESGLRDPGTGMQRGLLSALAGSFGGTALLVVLLVVSSTVTLALRQRRRELALLRAVGATNQQVRRQIGAELTLLTVLTAPLGAAAGIGLARLLRPVLLDAGVVGADFRFATTPLPAVSAVLVLLPVALIAARLASRETLRRPPTAAIREAAVEQREVGRVRRALAVATAVLGVSAAGSGLAVPGTIGAATAATSALLLVAAAALAGPLLVGWALAHLTRWVPGRGPVTRLALANSRGFSRRLAAVVVPLAVALSLGTVQSTVDSTVATAAERQLHDGLAGADLVATGADADRAADLAGVEEAVPLAATTAQVRVDDEEAPGLASLSWEGQSLRVLPPTGAGSLYDPGVVAGSLDALAESGTVAVSTDARLETGHGMGDQVEVRWADGDSETLTVVAVYDRGLGFGGYTTGAATVPTAPVDAVLIAAADPAGLAGALADLDLEASTPSAYAHDALSAAPQAQRLSMVLLLGLLVFVGLAAANALVMATAGRRDELTLLARTGATRRQLVGMAAVESLVIAAAAWAIGTLAVLPAVVGVSAGLLGLAVPPVDVTTYAVLSVAVVVTAVASVVPTVAVRARP